MNNLFYLDFLANKIKASKVLNHFSGVNWDKHVRNVLFSDNMHQQTMKLLMQQNKNYGSKYLSHLQEKNTVCIITGQQLGLFFSPLYTLYKAITAVKLAEFLNKKYDGYNFIPVFWLECEDHDFEEVNHFNIWDEENTLQRIEYKGERQNRQSIKRYRFSNAIGQVVDQFKTNSIKTEFTESLVNGITKSYYTGESWVNATRNFMHQVLNQTGILFFDPGDSHVKNLAIEFNRRWITQIHKIRQAFSEQSELLRNSGYTNQVSDIEGKTFLHVVNEKSEREHLYINKNSFYTGVTKKEYSHEAMNAFVKSQPDDISTSVVSRPLLQSWLLPTAVYVAGPGEIAYWAQLTRIFEVMAFPIPVVYPRMTITLVEPRINRYMKKNDINPEEVEPEKKIFLEKIFKRRLLQETRNPFLETKAQIDVQFEIIKSYIGTIDKTLLNTADKTYQSVMQHLQVLEGKTVRASQAKDNVGLKQIEEIYEAFFPSGTAQERIISPVYFLNKFGPSFIDKIYQQAILKDTNRQFIYL